MIDDEATISSAKAAQVERPARCGEGATPGRTPYDDEREISVPLRRTARVVT
jgi:hypothetical protein